MPLVELNTNSEGEAKYRMFPNAWKFIRYLNQRLVLAKEKKLPLIEVLNGEDTSTITAN